MTEEATALKKAYMKEWRRKNPDKVREANRRYWEKKVSEQHEKQQGRNNNTRIIDTPDN